MYNNLIMQVSFITEVIERLKWVYGKPEWDIRSDAISVLIQTILSQNTSDLNSGRAFESLLRISNNWNAIARTPLNKIVNAIQIGGLAKVKAVYIKQSLNEIKHRRGKLALQFLKKLPIDEARNWLMQLPGIGLKTANCVLLFSLRMPALPVDTHIYRISKRLGLIGQNLSVNKAHKELEGLVPAGEVYTFHVLLIKHGRKICKAQNPKCQECILSPICPSSETPG